MDKPEKQITEANIENNYFHKHSIFPPYHDDDDVDDDDDSNVQVKPSFCLLHGTLSLLLLFFFKWANPDPFSFIFGLFKQTLQILQQIYVKKFPSSIRCRDSNPRPSSGKTFLSLGLEC